MNCVSLIIYIVLFCLLHHLLGKRRSFLFLIGWKNFNAKQHAAKQNICEGLWLIAICYKVMMTVDLVFSLAYCMQATVHVHICSQFVLNKKTQLGSGFCFVFLSVAFDVQKTKEHTQAQLTSIHVNTQL